MSDLTSALQGNVAGLNFDTDAVSGGVGGETGAEIKFNIRGAGSINGSEPYVLVDGVEQSLQNVNPNDIESISVLKDACIWCARCLWCSIGYYEKRSERKGTGHLSWNGRVQFTY